MRENVSVVTLPKFGALDRLLAGAIRALEGKHPWGHFEAVAIGRGIWMHEALILLPPGTSPAERRTLTVHRYWPVVGALGVVFATAFLSAVLPPAVVFIVAFAIYGLVMWGSTRATRSQRKSLLRLAVVTVARGDQCGYYGNVHSMRATRNALARLDLRKHLGQLTTAENELEWASLYWTLDADREKLLEEAQQGIFASEEHSDNA